MRRNTLLIALIYTALGLALYLPFRSTSLDDFDSFNYIKALTEFAPQRMQPQPPGYVLYVALARIAHSITGEHRIALTTLAALSAALAAGAGAIAGARLAGRAGALITPALFICMPIVWINAEKAMSDTAGFCVGAVCTWLLLRAVLHRTPAQKRDIALCALALGIAAGLRPQTLLGLLAAFGAWLLFRHIDLKHKIAGMGIAAGAFLAGCLSWIVPLLAAFGWDTGLFLRIMRNTGGTVTSGDSLFSRALTRESLVERAVELWRSTATAVFGRDDLIAAAVMLGAILLTLHGIRTARGAQRHALILLVITLSVQSLFHALYTRLELTRHALPTVLPAALLVAAGITALKLPAIAKAALAGLVACIAAFGALPLAQTIARQPSPPYAAADQIRLTNTDPARTLIIAKQSYNALRYLLPQYPVRLADSFTPEALQQFVAESNPDFIFVADPETYRPDERYVQLDAWRYERDPRVHSFHATVALESFAHADAIPPGALSPPGNGRIELARPEHGKYLASGWYRAEDIGGVAARWSGALQLATMRIDTTQPLQSAQIRVLAFAPAQAVSLGCEDAPGDWVATPQSWETLDLSIPDACTNAGGRITLTLRVRDRTSPQAAGVSGDTRPLGVAVAWLELR